MVISTTKSSCYQEHVDQINLILKSHGQRRASLSPFLQYCNAIFLETDDLVCRVHTLCLFFSLSLFSDFFFHQWCLTFLMGNKCINHAGMKASERKKKRKKLVVVQGPPRPQWGAGATSRWGVQGGESPQQLMISSSLRV